MGISETQMKRFSEQDTADKLILPYLAREYGFPTPDSLDYQAQHTLPTRSDRSGRYDGLYLHGGYPYVLLEAKRYAHDLTQDDFKQGRDYATSEFFDTPVPFIVISNGREHLFFKKKAGLDPTDGKIAYDQIVPPVWSEVIAETAGRVRIILSAAQLINKLKAIKELVYGDIKARFFDMTEARYDMEKTPYLKEYLEKIIHDRRIYISPESDREKQIEHAIQTVSLHFTIKVLFIKILEDLSSGPDTPRIIHDLFPREEYVHLGGIFGFKVLYALKNSDLKKALRLYARTKRFYARLGEDLAKVTYEDIFRYGFRVHANEYGRLLAAKNYDRFFPTGQTLMFIRNELIEIDTRNAIIYETADARKNVIGDIYGKLIDIELRDSIGAVYTPDETVEFMVGLAHRFLKGFRGNKIVENACGSGHFHRLLYRRYVDEVISEYTAAGRPPDYHQAHSEAIEHVLGRDIDPFAVQLTLLGVFLEQLKDNVKANTIRYKTHNREWKASYYIDCQDSLDPITVWPEAYLDVSLTLDPDRPKSLLESCKRALNPDLVIGNRPYGVKVVKGLHYDTLYDLQSKDSYGYFIANAIARLPNGRRVIFITSSSFLTIKSHYKLRKFILAHCKIMRLVKLHRATFPGIDIFPIIEELEKCGDAASRESNFYEFYDLWQLHPQRARDRLGEVYSFILKHGSEKEDWIFDRTRMARYIVRQGLLGKYSQGTIFDGRPSLFEFIADGHDKGDECVTLERHSTEDSEAVRTKHVKGRKVVKLDDIAEAKVGLQVPSARDYYRIARGIKGGAVKGGYLEVNESLALSPAELDRLTDRQKSNGIVVDDPDHDKYFVPLDKTGLADIEGKILSQYYRPVEFYVDWSNGAIAEMRSSRSARFQNSSYYFRKGITFSDTGIYSPTFRLSHGGVFDQKSSCIFSDFFGREFMLGLLCSKLIKYFVKVFINHTVSSQVESIKAIPLVIPIKNEERDIEAKVRQIVALQQAHPKYDYFQEQAELDQMVYRLYNLDAGEIDEVESWYARRYPKLRRDIDVSDVEED